MLEPGSYALVDIKNNRYPRQLFPHYNFDDLEDGGMIMAQVCCQGKTRENSEDQEWMVRVGVDTPWIARRRLLPVEDMEETIFNLLPEVEKLYLRARDLARATGQERLAEQLQALYDKLNSEAMVFDHAALQAVIAKAAAPALSRR